MKKGDIVYTIDNRTIHSAYVQKDGTLAGLPRITKRVVSHPPQYRMRCTPKL
jgi:hypothetical protein